jgi:hypothetical protein
MTRATAFLLFELGRGFFVVGRKLQQAQVRGRRAVLVEQLF